MRGSNNFGKTSYERDFGENEALMARCMEINNLKVDELKCRIPFISDQEFNQTNNDLKNCSITKVIMLFQINLKKYFFNKTVR